MSSSGTKKIILFLIKLFKLISDNATFIARGIARWGLHDDDDEEEVYKPAPLVIRRNPPRDGRPPSCSTHSP